MLGLDKMLPRCSGVLLFTCAWEPHPDAINTDHTILKLPDQEILMTHAKTYVQSLGYWKGKRAATWHEWKKENLLMILSSLQLSSVQLELFDVFSMISVFLSLVLLWW